MKNLLKYERQENLKMYFFDYAILYKQKTIEKWTKAASSFFPRKATSETLRTTEA